MRIAEPMPDVAVLVLELDVLAVSVTEDAGFAFLFFQVEEAARQLLSLARLGVDHDGRGYYRIHYGTNSALQR